MRGVQPIEGKKGILNRNVLLGFPKETNKYGFSNGDEWNKGIISRVFRQNPYDFPSEYTILIAFYGYTIWLPFNIIDDKLRLQSRVFDLLTVSRNFAPNVAMAIL